MLSSRHLGLFLSVWLSSLHSIESFVSSDSRHVRCGGSTRQRGFSGSVGALSAISNGVLSVSLEKPLGLILEENNAGTGGVMVIDVGEGGSAATCGFADQLPRSVIATVAGFEVLNASFDEVMDTIMGAPSPFDITFKLAAPAVVAPAPAATEAVAEDAESEVVEESLPLPVGTPVTITVQQDGKPDIAIPAKVGDNLRQTLLSDKGVELYRGLKKKLGNCGGGAQCGFCAVEFIEGEGWGEKRSEYEDKKIGMGGGKDGQRLACINNIPGDATVRTL